MNVTSPATPSCSRDVARIDSVGEPDSRSDASFAAAPTTCSQLSRTSSAVRPARVLRIVSTADRPGCSRLSIAASTVGRDEVRIVDRGELDEPETIGEVQDRPLGHFHRQPGLSASADTEDAHDAVRAHEAEHRVDLAFAADERCELHGKVGERRIGGQQRLVDEREVGVAELVHALRTLDVLQVVDSHVLEPCAFGQLIGHEVVGGLRQDGLTSVRDGAEPRASDDRGALIGARRGSAPRPCAAPTAPGTARRWPTPAGARAHTRARPSHGRTRRRSCRPRPARAATRRRAWTRSGAPLR